MQSFLKSKYRMVHLVVFSQIAGKTVLFCFFFFKSMKTEIGCSVSQTIKHVWTFIDSSPCALFSHKDNGSVSQYNLKIFFF